MSTIQYRKLKSKIIFVSILFSLLTTNVYADSSECSKTYERFPDEYKIYAQEQCELNDLSYDMFCRVAYNESRFISDIEHINTNGTVDRGLCQINDTCVGFLIQNGIINSKWDLLDAYKNIDSYICLMSYHKNYTGDEKTALLRYQVGEGAFTNKYDYGNKTNDTYKQVIDYYEFYAGYNEDNYFFAC